MNAAEEQEIIARAIADRERAHVDAVVDGGRIAERRVSIGIADRHVVTAPVIFSIDGDDPLGGEPVDGRDDGRVDQPGKAERQEVEAVVDEVEFGGALEYRGDVQALPHLRVDVGDLPSIHVGRSRRGEPW